MPVTLTNSTLDTVQTVNFRSPNFAHSFSPGHVTTVGEFVDVGYDGPLAPVTGAIAESLVAGKVIDVPAPHSNSTYHTEFYGPSLRCTEIDRGNALWDNMAHILLNGTDREFFYYYISWPGNSTDSWELATSDSQDLSTESGRSQVALTVVGNARAEQSLTKFTMIQCHLWNATYAVDFRYDEGIQSVSSNITSYLQAVDGSVAATYENDSYLLNWAYLAVMESFQDFLRGTIYLQPLFVNTPIIYGDMTLTSLPLANELKDIVPKLQAVEGGSEKNVTMKDLLEEMFHNATLSLASRSSL